MRCLNQCCCCVSLKNGSIIAGVLTIIIYILNLINIIFKFVNYQHLNTVACKLNHSYEI